VAPDVDPGAPKASKRGAGKKKSPKNVPLRSDAVEFAHASERQFARLLDFYQIEWEYEPRSFDLEWDLDGNVTQRFTPDFYLPQWNMFIEITTLNQKLVTKKNRKIRRLRELYPEVSCKIFYQRDYLSLVRKYGLEDMAG
jgi:hypothetical protein